MTRRALSWLGLLALGAALWLAPRSGSRAQAPAGALAETAPERELLALLEQDQLVTARRKADELLARQPGSLVGHYALGRVMYQSEGNLPRAMYHFGRARQLYEQRYSVAPRTPGAPWQFHRELLFEIQSLAQAMEEFSYQLEILDYHDTLYEPDLTAERAWPLLRLGKIGEARRVAKEASELGDPLQRSLGLNALCAIEGEAKERGAYFDACLAAYENARKNEVEGVDEKHQSTAAVHAYNAALAARAALLPERAEELALAGTKRLAFTTANPWRLLVRLYSDQGRTKQAVEALRDMQAWRRKQPPSVRDQDRAETDVVFSTVLLLAAETDTGLRLLDLAIDRPDRRGQTSSSREQALGAHALLRRALSRTAGEIEAERASCADEPSLVARSYVGAGRRLGTWADEERVVSVLSDTDRLVATLRVFLRGGIEPVPVWLLGDLIEVLGPGVVAVALEQARKQETADEVAPYFDAVSTELAAARGDEERAIELGGRTLDKLPKSEALLRGRVAAVAAEAARRAGKRSPYLTLLEQALGLDPSVIRRLGLRIPARVELAERSATGQLVADKLGDSPRLRREKGAFVVAVLGSGRELRVCLRSPLGTELSCASAPPPPVDPKTGKPAEEPDRRYASRVAEAFHRRALAMPLGLDSVDLSSLDGTTAVAEQAARDRLREVLGEAVEGQ